LPIANDGPRDDLRLRSLQIAARLSGRALFERAADARLRRELATGERLAVLRREPASTATTATTPTAPTTAFGGCAIALRLHLTLLRAERRSRAAEDRL